MTPYPGKQRVAVGNGFAGALNRAHGGFKHGLHLRGLRHTAPGALMREANQRAAEVLR